MENIFGEIMYTVGCWSLSFQKEEVETKDLWRGNIWRNYIKIKNFYSIDTTNRVKAK